MGAAANSTPALGEALTAAVRDLVLASPG